MFCDPSTSSTSFTTQLQFLVRVGVALRARGRHRGAREGIPAANLASLTSLDLGRPTMSDGGMVEAECSGGASRRTEAPGGPGGPGVDLVDLRPPDLGVRWT